MCQRWRHEKEKKTTQHSEAAKTSPKDDFFINHLHSFISKHTWLSGTVAIYLGQKYGKVWYGVKVGRCHDLQGRSSRWDDWYPCSSHPGFPGSIITLRWDDQSSSLKLSVVLMLWLMGADLQHIGGTLWPMFCTMLGSRCLLVTWWCMTFMNVFGLCGCWKLRFKAETKNPIVHSCFRLHMKTNYARSIKHFHIC